MKIVILLILLLNAIGAQAQSDRDSLKRVWNNISFADTSRLNALYQLGHSFIDSDQDSAIYYAIIQNEFALERGLLEYSADAQDVLGDVYDSKGELTKAVNYYEKAYELFEKVRNRKKSASVLHDLGQVKWTAGEYKLALDYYRRSLAIADEINDKKRSSQCLKGIAYSYFQQGQYSTAMQYVQKSLIVSEEIDDEEGIAWCINALGVFYSRQGNSEKALEYYFKGLEINKKTGDQLAKSYSLRNIGNTYSILGDDEKALEYIERSLVIDEELNNKRSLSFSLNAIGEILNEQGEKEKALEYYYRCLFLAREIGNRDMECEYLEDIGSLLIDQGNYKAGISECQKSYDIALEIGSVVDQFNACDCLYKASKALGQDAKALLFHEKMAVLQDSINYEALAKDLQQMEFNNYMVADSLKKEEEKLKIAMAHQQEVSQKEKSRNMFMAGGLMLLMVAAGLYSRNRYVRKSRNWIEMEKDRSENLLLNILPAEIAEELKAKGKADARDFDQVSIIFTDFKGFTEQSAKLNTADLVNEINQCFEAFDHITEKYKIEKIKTIGDAYMAAGGLPVPTDDSVKNTILAALEMQAFISNRKIEKDAQNEPAFEMRVGIHTGPVAAGIVGVKKFQYDIWGDAVNTASRMESSGEVGRVNISQATYDLVKDDVQFNFTPRGKVEVKGKGEMEMYYVAT
ncbi:MAG: tetratricopeptide repeat protein [Bacteroidales bacterium]|nr:tetratricopeptide repeat protein [Bacteroidales bacterium]